MVLENTTAKMKKVKIAVLAIIICCIDFLILQISIRGVRHILFLDFFYGLINLGILFVFIGCIYAMTTKLWLAEMISSLIFTIYSIINVYVVEFHGTPLTIPEFKNTKSAINVLGGYSFTGTKSLICIMAIIVLFILDLMLIKTVKREEIEEDKKKISQKIFKMCFFFGCGALYLFCILSSQKLVEPLRRGFHFSFVSGEYGYPYYFLASGIKYTIGEPSGYSEEKLETVQIEKYLNDKSDKDQKPDIILIMNETFYDISLVSNIETDNDYMREFYNMDNSILGHAIVPRIGGGTNNSEYELLTSNSTYLFQEITPFQTLNMSNAISIVSNLKDMGYYTMAVHPEVSTTYNRKKVYPLLGFEDVYFKDDVVEKEFYGDRVWITDRCAYNYMIQWYEKALEEKKPIFSYLLTVQNHGGWNINASEEDTVHVQNYKNKEYEEIVNEYLSCISLSMQEFNKLIEYFKNSERPVILCMVGDHSPSFIGDIADDDSSLLQRATPFIIWANFPIEEKKDVMISINQLGPLLLETAGVDMMPYYQYISQLGKEVPVLTSYGEYVDKNGNVYSYTDDTEYSDAIQKYFWLEYNNLQEESIDEWFSVK